MIQLIESTHTYINDKFPNCKYTSTTTALGYYHDPYDVDFFAEKVALREGVTKEEIIMKWDRIRDSANEYGTYVHGVMERYLKAPNKLYSPRDEYEKKLIAAFNVCCLENKLTILGNQVKSEHIMSIEFDDSKGLAGTADIIEDVDGYTFNVWDFKTNKKFDYDSKYDKWLHFPVNHLTHCQYNEYALQLSIYGVMYERETNKKLNRCGIFYWDRNTETFSLIPINYLKTDADNLLTDFKYKKLNNLI